MRSSLQSIRTKGRSVKRIARSSRDVPKADWKLLLEAFGLVVPIFAALRVTSFKKLDETLARLGERKRTSRGALASGEFNTDPEDPTSFPNRAAWAVRSVSRRMFPNKPCLIQALALRLMLRQRGLDSTIEIALRHDEKGELAAHAWLKYEGHTLIGGFRSTDGYSIPMILDEAHLSGRANAQTPPARETDTPSGDGSPSHVGTPPVASRPDAALPDPT